MKQAVLIIAHNDLYTLRKNILLLNDNNIDIFVHIDKKSAIKKEDVLKDLFVNNSQKSNIIVYKTIKVNWGGTSQIKVELFLLKKCIEYSAERKCKYGHLHLISGADLFIKTPRELCEFFKKYQNKEFIHFYANTVPKRIEIRYKYYHFFTESRIKRTKIYAVLNGISMCLQKLFRISRIKNNDCYQYGANWFSITMDFAKYISDKEISILKKYKWTNCCDEVFIQTEFINSTFKNNLYLKNFSNDYRGIARLIDWERGKPYVFRFEDKSEISHSDMFFARKFNSNIDKMIIDEIYKKND